MFNQDLLRTITVLYVEDEERIRLTMYNVFVKLFKKVYVAVDGKDGFELYKEIISKDEEIDIVVADINMPVMSGLDMLESIREFDKDLPFILTTAHAESDYLLRAIDLNVRHYAVKPLQIKDVMLQIQDICENKFNEKIIKHQAQEKEQYISILNQAAIVSKTDPNGVITYVNELFCEVSGYTQKELIGQNHNILTYPDVSKSFFKKMWNTISAGDTWKGKVKNQTKDGQLYIVYATIFPILDDIGENIIGYMSVQFVITEDETEKRLFHHKVIQDISDYRQKAYHLTKEVEKLKKQLKYSSRQDIALLIDALELEKQKNQTIKNQLSHYEEDIKLSEQKYNLLNKEYQDRTFELNEERKECKQELQNYQDKLISIQNEFTDYQNKIKELENIVKEQRIEIKNLNEVIQHREEELYKFKKKKKK
jgi:PAS domain S-box-containing protein